jgi:hypothetical protein
MPSVKGDVSFAPQRRTVSVVLGGILGFTYPAVLIVLSLSVGFRRGGEMADFAATLAGTVLFLVAAPTAWVLSFSFIEVTRFTVLVFGIVTSAPLWYLLGSGLARRAEDWFAWVRRYTFVCIGWTASNLVVFGVIAALAG